MGPALSWLVVAHVVLAGWCMVAYARRQDLGRAGAMTAAIGYMFAGKWMFHLLDAGHYILIGLAWLPLFLLLLESAIRRGSLVRATAAGAVFALVILSTHPQWTFYAALFAAAWTLGTALESAGRSTPAALGRWLGVGLWAAVVAGALSRRAIDCRRWRRRRSRAAAPGCRRTAWRRNFPSRSISWSGRRRSWATAGRSGPASASCG